MQVVVLTFLAKVAERVAMEASYRVLYSVNDGLLAKDDVAKLIGANIDKKLTPPPSAPAKGG